MPRAAKVRPHTSTASSKGKYGSVALVVSPGGGADKHPGRAEHSSERHGQGSQQRLRLTAASLRVLIPSNRLDRYSKCYGGV